MSHVEKSNGQEEKKKEKSNGQEEKKKKAVNGSVRSMFMHADKVDMVLMVMGFIGAVVDGFAGRLVLIFIAKFLNNIGTASTMNVETLHKNLDENALAMVYVASGLWFACFLEGYCWTRTSERQAAKMRMTYLKAVLRQDVGYFDLHEETTSEVIATISNDSHIIQDALSEKVPDMLRRVSRFAACYLVAFILLWRLALVALPLALFLVVTGLYSGRSLMRLAAKIREEYSKAGSVAEQAISSIRTVYAYGRETATVKQFSEALHGTTKLGLRQGLVKGLAVGSKDAAFAVWSAMAYYGSILVISHSAKGGTIYAVGNAIVNGAMELGVCLSNLKDIAEAISVAERMNEMIKRIPEIDSDDLGGRVLEYVSGQVEFKNVKFAYPSRSESMVCSNLCLTIPSGKTIALVGSSGSGKSTVLSLLQRFYDPIEGKILLDGFAIDKLQLKWLRSQMALVSQEPLLFSTTIKENILFGKEDSVMEDVLEAASASNAHNFISELPQGYDSEVGEKGVQLSGGQKQRIAIARAIIRKPRILLLDEATSALDYESESVVQEALDNVALGRTTIVVAHRLSTIKNVDIIAVMEHGKVVETGSHSELILLQDGLYNSLVHAQQMQSDSNSHKPIFSASSSASSTHELNKTSSISQSFSLEVNKSRSLSKSSMHNQAFEDSVDALEDSKAHTPSFWGLLSMSKLEWKQGAMGCSSAVLVGAVQPLYSFALGGMISVYFLTDHNKIKQEAKTYAFWFIGMFVFSFFINICQHFNFAYMGEYLTKRIRENILSKILTFEIGWFDKIENSSGIINSTLIKDANVARSLMGDRVSLIAQTIAAVGIAWIMGLVIAWRLAIVTIATQPIVIISFYTRGVLLKTMSKKARKAQNESCRLAAESVSNLRTITAFSSQDRMLRMLAKAQHSPCKENIRQSWIAGIGIAFSQSIYTCNWSLNYWYGGKLVANGYLTAKAAFETIFILIITGRVIADAGSMTTDLAKGVDSMASIFAILDRDTKIEPESSEGYEPKEIKGHIQLRDVHFAYPARPDLVIFPAFSINIEAGQSTALVGRSGSGKTTIIGLIERFYDPLKGVVMIDGRDIRSYNLRSLRKHIAVVSQETTLFAGTIWDNIAYGAPKDVDEMEIIEAAKAANAHNFISGLVDGYQTWCGDKGTQLSGGQKQRIAIAQALLRNPRVLLLDEATSALDSKSEKMVQDALEHVMVGRTSVVVAHRLSTIQKCDVIFVLDKGKVVEKGTHSSLMDKGSNGVYCSLFRAQGSK